MNDLWFNPLIPMVVAQIACLVMAYRAFQEELYFVGAMTLGVMAFSFSPWPEIAGAAAIGVACGSLNEDDNEPLDNFLVAVIVGGVVAGVAGSRYIRGETGDFTWIPN